MNLGTNNKNPFSSGSMIRNPERFFGRRSELDLIMARLNGTQHEGSSVVGKRRIGKSSLLHYIYQPRSTETVRAQDGLMVVYLDAAEGACNTPDLFRANLVRRLLDVYTPSRRSNDGKWLADLREQLPTRDTFTWAEARQAIEKVPFHPVICLDEFESLITLAFDIRFFTSLRSWQNDGLLTWITASAKPLKELGLIHAELHGVPPTQSSPFFNLLATVSLEGFSERAITELLASAETASILFTDREKRKIRQLAGDHPFHLQIVAEQAWSKKRSGQTLNWRELRQYLCQQPSPPDNCQPKWRKIKHGHIAWLLVGALALVLYFLVPGIQSGVISLGEWLGTVWQWLGNFGDGLGGLILVIGLVVVIGGGIWQRKRLGTIARELWEKIS